LVPHVVRCHRRGAGLGLVKAACRVGGSRFPGVRPYPQARRAAVARAGPRALRLVTVASLLRRACALSSSPMAAKHLLVAPG